MSVNLVSLNCTVGVAMAGLYYSLYLSLLLIVQLECYCIVLLVLHDWPVLFIVCVILGCLLS